MQMRMSVSSNYKLWELKIALLHEICRIKLNQTRGGLENDPIPNYHTIFSTYFYFINDALHTQT